MKIEIKKSESYSNFVPIDTELENEFLRYRKIIDKLVDAKVLPLNVAISTLTIMRIKLGLPTLAVNPMLYELDLITLKSD
jgi:hypothetical protein